MNNSWISRFHWEGKFVQRKVISLTLVMVMVLSMFSFANAAETVNITIAHTNDTHARIEEGKYAGMGFAKLATKVAELKAANPNVLLLDAGDTFHGQTVATLVKGESIVTIMNSMGYDAMTAGNHDFNYGQERLVELAEMADFPILAANVKKADGSTLVDSYVIKEIGGVKVGIFGLATPETTYKTHPNNVKGLTFASPVEEAKAMVAELEGKADIVIALAHLGVDEESTYTSKLVAEQVDGIDVIIDGHSHTALDEGLVVNGTLIAQTGEYDKNLGIIELDYADGAVTASKASLFAKDAAAEVAEDPAVLAVVAEVKAANDVITSVKVGDASFVLDGERGQVRAGETNLGNFIADAMLAETGADIAFTNGGGIRASIQVGEITKGDVITVLPFGNYVVVKSVSGADIKAALEHGIDAYPETKGAFPHVAGMTFKFDPNKPAGSRLLEVKVNGMMIDSAKMYTFATNDFIAAGGDGYKMLGDDAITGEYPGLDEVVISYIAANGTEAAKVDNRVVALPVVAAPVEVTPAPEMKSVVYVVKANDVLWKIAKSYSITWKEIADYNKLTDPNLIMPGQEIMIPKK